MADVRSEKREVKSEKLKARTIIQPSFESELNSSSPIIPLQRGAKQAPSREGWTFRGFRNGRGVFISFLLSILLILFLLPVLSSAQDIPDQPSGHVNDFAQLLTSGERQQLETKLRNYRDTTTTVIAIATVNSLDGRSVDEVSTELFNKWNIWEGDKNNGVLILIAKQERRMRIEVGYGLEGAIPDIMAGRIIRNVLNPAFKKGDYYGGLDKATSIIIDLARGEYKGDLTKQNQDSGSKNTASNIIFFLFIIYVIYASSRKGSGKNGGKRRRTLGPLGFIFLGGGGGGFGGSGGGGGFGGFSGGGGFGSGGGGASGGW